MQDLTNVLNRVLTKSIPVVYVEFSCFKQEFQQEYVCDVLFASVMCNLPKYVMSSYCYVSSRIESYFYPYHASLCEYWSFCETVTSL